MSDVVILYLRNDQIETLSGFKDAETGGYLNEGDAHGHAVGSGAQSVAAFTDVELVYVPDIEMATTS
jgi:hypothetical protein